MKTGNGLIDFHKRNRFKIMNAIFIPLVEQILLVSMELDCFSLTADEKTTKIVSQWLNSHSSLRQ